MFARVCILVNWNIYVKNKTQTGYVWKSANQTVVRVMLLTEGFAVLGKKQKSYFDVMNLDIW